jgi:hypothetical protein
MGSGISKKTKAGRPCKVTDEELIQAIHETRGMLSLTAKRLNISRRAVESRIANTEEIREALWESRELGKDKAEIQLFKAIDSGNMKAVLYYLERQAKDRGYFRDGLVADKLEYLLKRVNELESKRNDVDQDDTP